jgi:glycosyltransferase involved in cell wall biosynthesis
VKGIFMKIVFVSNYFNHHQKPFCEEMYKRLGAGFSFISTSVMREERKKLGYSESDCPEYVLLSYESEEKKKEALSLINAADVVIAGAAPNEMLLERICKGKLLLRYSERPFKKKCSFWKRLYYAFQFRKRDLFKKNVYMLCASAYTASDYASLGMYKNRMYKWGYFPEVKEYDIDNLLSQKRKNTLTWCGRFIDWKHPDNAIKVARKLKEDGYEFHLNMIGAGVMEDELKQLVKGFELEDRVCFLGSMPPERVRSYMEESGIYLFTSDRQEGWGAVLNEAMNSGCAVVANHAIGSVPFLLEDGKNGYIYTSEDMLYEKVKYLLDHPEKQASFGNAAYLAIRDTWNAKIAVDRVLQLAEVVLSGEKSSFWFEYGSCSKAVIMN